MNYLREKIGLGISFTLIAVGIALIVVSCVAQKKAAKECGEKGGVYFSFVGGNMCLKTELVIK